MTCQINVTSKQFVDNSSSSSRRSAINMDIYELGHSLTIATGEIYGKVLEKFGTKMSEKFLKDATQEEKECFIKRLKEAQIEKLTDRLTLIMNRILTDHHFVKSYDEIMAPYKSIDELKQDNEIANNHLQSVENERSILQRDTDMAIDRVESLCEAILEHKIY